jgi:hypothetical protein
MIHWDKLQMNAKVIGRFKVLHKLPLDKGNCAPRQR